MFTWQSASSAKGDRTMHPEALPGAVGLHNHQSPAFTYPEPPALVGGSTNVVTQDRTDVQSPALVSPVEGGSMGEDAGKAQIPAGGGRAVQVRPCHAGDGVQLAILSTRGNCIEAVTLDASQLAGLVGALKQAQLDADAEHTAVIERNKIRRTASYEAALARNPHLNGSRPLGGDKYIVRPR